MKHKPRHQLRDYKKEHYIETQKISEVPIRGVYRVPINKQHECADAKKAYSHSGMLLQTQTDHSIAAGFKHCRQ